MLPFFTCRSEVLLDFCIPVQSFQFHCFLGNMIWFLVDVGLSSTVVFLHLQYGATRVECQPDGTLAYPGAPAQGDNGHGSLPEPLTLTEELVIRRFYEQKIQQVSAAFSFPNKIQV
jgi:hypothetical protein